MARLKLHLYESVIPDCQSSLELLPINMKAYFFIAQAELELGRKNDALRNAEMAYDLCSGLKVGSRKLSERIAGYDSKWASSLPAVSALVLRCKKEVWEVKERARLRDVAPLLQELTDGLEDKRAMELAELERQDGLGNVEKLELQEEIKNSYRGKLDLLWETWARGAGIETKRREVPDWAIDDITFSIMHDPVTVCSVFPEFEYEK